MKFKNKIKNLALELCAKVNATAAKDCARRELEKALEFDNPKALEKALAKCGNWMSKEDINKLKISVVKVNATGDICTWYPNWQGALIVKGLKKSIEWALLSEKVSPEDIVDDELFSVYGRSNTFRDYAWVRGAHLISSECWSGHAKQFPEKWQFNKYDYFFSNTENNGFCWLKSCFIGGLDLHKRKRDLMEKSGGWNNTELYETKFHINISGSHECIIDLSRLKLPEFINMDRDKLEKLYSKTPSIISQCEATVGIHSDVYKKFVDIGWCTAEDVYRFQEWVKPHDKLIDRIGLRWFKEDVAAWSEKELLSSKIGLANKQLSRPKNAL